MLYFRFYSYLSQIRTETGRERLEYEIKHNIWVGKKKKKSRVQKVFYLFEHSSTFFE